MDADSASHQPSGKVGSNNRERSRFEIAVDGSRAGMALYTDHAGQRIFFHTEIDDAYSGKGLAAVLVRHALDETRGEGLRIVPVCPYVAAYVKRHHDWDDVLDHVTRDSLAAVDAHLAG